MRMRTRALGAHCRGRESAIICGITLHYVVVCPRNEWMRSAMLCDAAEITAAAAAPHYTEGRWVLDTFCHTGAGPRARASCREGGRYIQARALRTRGSALDCRERRAEAVLQGERREEREKQRGSAAARGTEGGGALTYCWS